MIDAYREKISSSIANQGLDLFVAGLVRRGLSDKYAKGVATRMLHMDQLAPKEFPAVEALCNTAGTDQALVFFELVQKVRLARQQAGRVVSGSLLSRLGAPAVVDALAALPMEGFTQFTVEGWGQVMVSQVISVEKNTLAVPYSDLGTPLGERGKPWLG